MNKNLKKVLMFLSLTFFFSWLLAILFFTFGGKWNTPASLAMAIVYMFIPMMASIVVQKFIYKEPLKKPLGISFKLNRWFLVAWLLPLFIAFASIGVSLLFPGVHYSPGMEGFLERFESILTEEQLRGLKNQIANSSIHLIWLGILQGLIAGITINAVAGFGEELGWRGLLQRELGFMGFWKSSAVIGVIWGIWHAPIILQGHNYPRHPFTGVFMMTILTLLWSPVFSYIRLKANSVIAAAIFHGSLNATAGLSLMFTKGGGDLIVGVTGLAGFIVLVVINIILFLYERLAGKSISTQRILTGE
ncbi:MAG: CPBP family intramembrane glutamic endopeptidase [Sedimentisphaerales bacterium]|jgi:membrane protease YdiL (CAAX protease family)